MIVEQPLKFEPSETHVAVIMGGWSPEREVSLVSGAAYAEALNEVGYKVTQVDAGHDLGAVLRDLRPDVVVNALHGQWGEDGCIQGLLEILEIPYTHSGVLASSLAMDKQLSKPSFREAGIPVADSLVVDRREAAKSHLMKPPYIIKPVNQGSSVGVFVIRNGDNRPPEQLTRADWKLGEKIMVEAFVPGRELTVGVVAGRALAVTEILPETDFYDYEAKYAAGGSRHVVPADIPKEIEEQALDYALKAHEALGCRGATRSDFRYDDTKSGEPGSLILLEINTQPGMTPTSLLPEQAQAIGISFAELVQWMVEDASCQR